MRLHLEIAAFTAATLLLSACPGGDDGDTAAGSTTTSQGSTSMATGSTSVSTTQPTTSAGTAEGSSGSEASGPGTGSTGSPGTGSTGNVDTGASGSSGEPGTTGAVCVEEQGSCAMGEMCCQGLTCCGGVPVPEGQEYCGMECPDSDFSRKREFAAVDADEVLERVMALPITEWSYLAEDPSVRHLGPMAQDFKASFGLGSTDIAIAKVDADGVALASIQALGHRLARAEAENAALRESLASLQAKVQALESAGAAR